MRTPLWREAHFQVKRTKHTRVGALLEVEMSKKCRPLWREAHFQVKMYKHTGVGALLEVEMSTKHISKSKCTTDTMLRALLELGMSKKCTALWRELHFEAKSVKN